MPGFRREYVRAQFWQKAEADLFMAVFTCVICAVDFSDHSARALRYAAALSMAEHAQLHVISVIDPLLADAAAAAYDLESLSAETASDLRLFITTTLGHRPDVRDPAIRIAVGDAAREILRAAETVRADLIVLGTHGLGGLRKLFFGSTTDHVLRDAGTAVLAVPLAAKATTSPFNGHAPIVVGVDVERPFRTHVDRAVALARDFKTSVVVVHAVPPIQTSERWSRHAARTRQQRERAAQMALDVICAETRNGVGLKSIVESGNAGDVLAKVAADEEAGLIVIGLGSPSGVGHRPGTTAYRVVSGAEVPVLAIPDPS